VLWIFAFLGLGGLNLPAYLILWIALPLVPAAEETAPSRTKSSGSVIVEAAKQNKLGTALTALIVLLVLAAAVFGVYSFLQRALPFP